MNSHTRLALARVQVADVVRRLVPKLNAAGHHPAAALLLDVAMDVALEIARERAVASELAEALETLVDAEDRAEEITYDQLQAARNALRRARAA